MVTSTLPWSGYSAKTTQKLPWTGYSQKAVTPTAPPAAPTPTEGIPPTGVYPFPDPFKIPGMATPFEVAEQAKAITPLSEIPPIVIKQEDLGFPPSAQRRPSVELTFGYNEASPDIFVLHNDKKVGTVDDKGNIKLDDPMYVWKTIVPSYWERQRLKQTGEYPAEKILQVLLKASRWMYSPKEIDITDAWAGKVTPTAPEFAEKKTITAPAPAQVLGVIGLIGSLGLAGYQGISALQQVGWSGVRNELLTPFKSTLDTYIKHNTKDIALLAQRVPSSLSSKQKILQNVYNFHNQYMARRAREIAAAQLQARMGRAPTVNIEQEVKYLTSATQTTDNLATAINKGTALTTTNVQGLVVSGTPTEFTQGINAIISGQAVTGGIPTIAGVEFNPITTKVGKGYEIVQNNEVVGTVSYSTKIPGVDGIVMDRIDIAEAARRQGLATQAVQRILSEAESQGVPLYTGMMEADGVQLFNALEQRGIVSLTPAPERMLGELVTRGVPQYAPTTAMAEWETVTGKEVTVSLETSSFGTRQGLVKLFGAGKTTINSSEFWAKYDALKTRLAKLNEGTPTWKSVKADFDAIQAHINREGISREVAIPKAKIPTVGKIIPKVTPKAVKPTATAVKITAPDAKKLRQSIMGTVKIKGLSESKYRALFKQVGGTRNLTEMGADKLTKVLDAVREARPIKIQGKNVITAKTEKAIQTLKDILIAEKKLTPGMYENLKKGLGLETDKYESRELFITERQAHSLIRQMNVEGEVGLTKWDVLVSAGLANKPELRTSIEGLTKRIVTENKPKPKKGITIPFRKVASEISEFPDDVGLSGMMSILRALRRFQEQLGGREVTRIYENAEMMVEQRRLNEITLANTVNAMKMKAPQLATIIKDKNKMDRIQQWLDADLKIADITKPDLTPDELGVAQLFRARYDQWKNAVRLERFKDAYYHYGGRAKEVVADLIKNGTEGTSDVAIPDAPLKDIKEAIGIYEVQGETALREYLNTKDWGVLKSGYSFSQILHPKLRMYRGVTVRATTTSLHQRKGLDFLRDERTAWERLIAYERQMIGLNLQPYYRKMDTEFRKAVDSGRISPESAKAAASKISQFMREVKGFPIESPVIALLLRIGGWSFGTLAKVPWMSVRNLHQNIAFGADKTEIVKALLGKGFYSNPLTKRGRLDYTEALVHQYKGVQQEQILMGYMGKTPIENLIRKTDYYHLSDKANRYVDMNGYGAKAERALNQYLKDRDVAKFLRDSGANDLSATEQIKTLEYLALEMYDYHGVLEIVSGGEASIRDIANRRTTLDHLNYIRYLRSAYEMGEMGRIIGSLVAFPRGVTERYVDIFSRIKRLGGADRKRAIHSLIAMIVGSAIASVMLKQLTGKERDAYNPLLIMQWQVGGLAIGATQNLMELYRLITNLTFAEDEGQKKYYYDELALLIPQLGDSFVPFYSVTMNLLESLVDSKYMDRKWLRQIREIVDENYELNDEFYQVERNWLERVQHGLFGTNTPDPSDLEQALRKLEGTAELLGQVDREELDKAKQKAEEDNKPFDYTEDDFIYRTNDLGSDISSAIYGLDPSEIITENGFSPLVLQYAEYQEMKDDYFDVPADKRYAYRESHPEVDANLFFWSYVVTLQSNEANQIVQGMINYYNVPTSAIRGYEKVSGGGEGGLPWTGGGIPSTGGLPWSGYASK